ncbi:MAG: DNA primase [Candidatus Levybacteria bacterium RIFCSPLOWO2_02_FULL_36_8b]|nr:MAG: DNA primase [Candidatus Levybacteria bacterium RIFCSPLOWO2_02_FULL_36_8b]
MDEVAQIRERIDIVSFISEYISLKKMGRNFKANCPFHNEKTPSFIVSSERQIWHCFGGCNKGGDAYSFLMEYENLEFIEALRVLSKRTGIQLKESNFQAGATSKKEIIYKLNKSALEFYHYVLTKHKAGKRALDYLTQDRKLDARLIETFMLGFSPKTGTSLSNYLIDRKKCKREDLVEAGLAFYSGGPTTASGLKDFFRNRVMFPLFDHRGNVTGFSGRAVEDPYDGGKYINTRDTIVYHKGSQFFGLNTAKEEIKKLDKAIVVEGELDVISCFAIGVKNVIAVKGTALTENQVALISRFTSNVCLCFDQDEAGFTAAKRSLPVLEKKGVNITTCLLGKSKDADEAIKKDPISFKKSVKKDIPIYDMIFAKTFSSFEKDKIEGKRNITDELLPIFAKITNEIVKEHYLRKLSLDLDVSLDALSREIEKIEKKEVVKDTIFVVKKDKRTRIEILEDYLMALLIQHGNPKSILKKCLLILKDYRFKTDSYQKIIDHLFNFFKGNSRFDSSSFLNLLPKELVSSFDASYLFPLPKFESNDKYILEAEKIAGEIRALFLKDKIREISVSLRAGERSEDVKKITDLEKELTSAISLLSKS